MSNEALQLKEKGNEAFQKGNYVEAIEFYTKAIEITKHDTHEKSVIYKNRAAAYLKLERYKETIEDATAALNIVANDSKALYRRCQALEKLGRFEEAYVDARNVLLSDPTNKTIQPVLARLHAIVQTKLEENAITENKAQKMIDIAFDPAKDEQMRDTAFNNLIVLSRENAGAETLWKRGIVQKIVKLLKNEKNDQICIAGVRVLSELCKGRTDWTKRCVKEIGVPWFIDLLNSTVQEKVNAVQHCVQTVINSLSGMENKLDSIRVKEICDENQTEIDTILTCLSFCTTSRTITGLARDAIINIITRNVHYKALNWAERFVEIKGVPRLLEVASELEEYKYESAMEITANTHEFVSICLSNIYENMYYDQARERFMKSVNDFIREKLLSSVLEGKVRAVAAVTALLRGPLDAGNHVIAKEGMMEMIIGMAGTEDILQQKVACECIIEASSKKDKSKMIIKEGVNILKKLYNSKDDSVRVRALVGLCKLGSSGGTDASIRPFANGASQKLTMACRKFLVNPTKDNSMRCWAAEGLSFLTLNAEVKEILIEDATAIKALIELAKTGDQRCIYGVVTTFVNLCNAYEKQEILPEMLELAKFAKHHIPEEHELDDPDFVQKRIEMLGKAGITYALVELSKTESKNSKELIGRVLNALCGQEALRGVVVQQGGVKALLSMSLDGTDKGKRQAAQALARISISINPEVAFPGQRMLEVVRPLVSLLAPSCSALETFEALLALCNIASVSSTCRKRILKEGGYQQIELYMLEEHTELRRAAVQVMTNLIREEDVIEMYEGDNDKTKMIALLCFEEDEETAEAAAGVLAMLTGSSTKVFPKLFAMNDWHELFLHLLANQKPEITHRGLVLVQNILGESKEYGQKLIETKVLEVLMALSKSPNQTIGQLAEEALKIAEKMELIMKNVENVQDSSDSARSEGDT